MKKTNEQVGRVLSGSLSYLESHEQITASQSAWWKELLASAGKGRAYTTAEFNGCLEALSTSNRAIDALMAENRETEVMLGGAIDRLIKRIDELVADKNFLLKRALRAGGFASGEQRDYGASSNSLVAIAYGSIPPEKQVFPSDAYDLGACVLAFERLPAHRKTKTAREALDRATNFLAFKRRPDQD